MSCGERASCGSLRSVDDLGEELAEGFLTPTSPARPRSLDLRAPVLYGWCCCSGLSVLGSFML